MKAVVIHEFGGPEVLKYEDTALPEPKNGELLIRVSAAGVNALDWKLRQGRLRGFMDFPLPLILGCDVAGTVESASANGDGFKPGTRVFGMPAAEVGMYAQFAALKPEELAVIPDALSFVQAASLPVVALTAWQALFDVGGLEKGQTVLIHGAAGGVGSIAVQLAKWIGATVAATAAGEKAGFVKSLGADQVVDYQTQEFEEQVKDVDLVLDVLGGETRARSWRTLKRGGILVSTLPPFPTDEEGASAGAHGKGIAVHPDAAELTKIADLAAQGHLKPVVDRTLPLASAGEAHTLLQGGKVQGKLVLTVT